MGMAVGDSSGGPINEINVTPMVDVMLVLLIIFMVITPMLQAGVTVTLPKAKHSIEDAAIEKESSVVIAITYDGIFYVGKDIKTDLKDVTDEVERRLKDKPNEDRIVYVKSDAGVSYGQVVQVIDAVREAGYDRIGLVTDREKEKKK
jgi:biopolymer transport protein ExbD/biopolymer transport protein TolR